jgi:hypothetical protein
MHLQGVYNFTQKLCLITPRKRHVYWFVAVSVTMDTENVIPEASVSRFVLNQECNV